MKDFLDKLLKQFGEEALVEENETIMAISTGSISLDASIGIGGIPRGRVTEIFGPEGCGKTTICLNTSMNCIKDGGKVLYVDAEHMLDYGTVKNMLSLTEIDKTKLIIVRPTTAENAADMIEYGIDSKEFELIVLDSVASLSPKAEKEADKFEDQQMMLLAKFMAKLLRRNMDKIRNQKIAFVLVNQVRDDTQNKFLKVYLTPGGHHIKHSSAVRISLTKGIAIKQGETTIGTTSKFTIAKNKVSAPFRSYVIPIIFGLGVDYYRDLINFGVDLGVIDKSGAMYSFGDKSLGRGANQVALNLQSPDYKLTLDKIQEEVYNITNKTILEEEIEEYVENDSVQEVV